MYRCEWNNCDTNFWSRVDLERHVKRHIRLYLVNNGWSMEVNSKEATFLLSSSLNTSLSLDSLGAQGPPDISLPRGPSRSLFKCPSREGKRARLSTNVTPSGSLDRPLVSDASSDIICVICLSGNESLENQIVLCDGCDFPYHQQCHLPRINSAAVIDQEALWYCQVCTVKK